MSDKIKDDQLTQTPQPADEQPSEPLTAPLDEQPEAQEQLPSESGEETPSKGGKKKKERKKLTPEQKKKRTIKALIITGSIVLVLAIFFSGIAIGNTVISKGLLKQGQKMDKVEYTLHPQLEPHATAKDDGEWTYFELPSNRDEFKVLQLTDVHIGGGSFSKQKDSWAMNAVATMIRQEQPDLVIVTGDIAYPVPFQAGTFNNLNATKIFANMMESLQVYWTFAFGNHDTEAYSMYSRKDITEYYEKSNFKYCLYERGLSDEDDKFGKIDKGFGNHIINVKKDGKVIQSLVMFDSHSYIDGDYFGIAWKYDNIHDSQVKWYTEEMDKINQANGGGQVKNLAFFHIPLVEYREAWKALRDLNHNEGVKLVDGVTATVPADEAENRAEGTVTFRYGVMGESEETRHGVQSYGIFCGINEDSLFEKGLEYGLQGAFCGHDHYNNFSIEYMGIRLTYGMSVDYLAYPGIYKEHLQRGCTVIEIESDGAFDCEQKNYYKDYNAQHEKG